MDEYVLYLYSIFLRPEKIKVEYEDGTIAVMDFDMMTVLEDGEWEQYDLHGD